MDEDDRLLAGDDTGLLALEDKEAVAFLEKEAADLLYDEVFTGGLSMEVRGDATSAETGEFLDFEADEDTEMTDAFDENVGGGQE
jgi:hypothetical protein